MAEQSYQLLHLKQQPKRMDGNMFSLGDRVHIKGNMNQTGTICESEYSVSYTTINSIGSNVPSYEPTGTYTMFKVLWDAVNMVSTVPSRDLVLMLVDKGHTDSVEEA